MKKWKQKLEKLNLNSKKETTLLVITSVISLILPIAVFLLTQNIIYLICVFFISLAIFMFFFRRYDYLLERRRVNLELEFIEVFSYLRIYLSNSESVYRSLVQSSEYTSQQMKNEINTFVKKIDDDKTIKSFIEFSNLFKNKLIEEVMISLYQMIDGGFTNNYLNQFITLFDNFKNRYLNEDLHKRIKKMDLFNSLSLFGGAYIMLLILLLIVNAIGGLINGF